MRSRLFIFFVAFVLGAIAFPAAALLAMRAGWWPIRANVPPPAWEVRLAGSAVHAAIERQASAAQNPVRPTHESLVAGLMLYRNSCAGCHGAGRRQSTWGTKNFYPPVPQFGSGHQHMSEAEMFWVVKHGIRYSGMAAWDGLLPDDQLWTIVTFLSHADDLPADIASEWQR
jgi:mono/diheme cytochrome c family protein